MDDEQFGLPRKLANGLVLRWATAADIDAVADFNFRMHNDAPDGQPELWLRDWTRNLMSGRHPTTSATDFTVVVDERQSGKIVSSAALISQTWTYDGLPFGCGRPELIGTDEAYRRRGLVRYQMETLHAKSAARGELVQAITGIPWYYRQFGYEMALALGGWRPVALDDVRLLPEGEEEPFHLRPATAADQWFLQAMYGHLSRRSLIGCQRDEGVWCYELAGQGQSMPVQRNIYVVEAAASQPVASVEMFASSHKRIIREFELSVLGSHSWRQVSQFLVRESKRQLEKASGAGPGSAVKKSMGLSLGAEHPAYDALGSLLGPPTRPYAWYLRVPDLAGFLRQIGPVLEERLAASTMAGYDGRLRISFYTHHLALEFSAGCLRAVESYNPEHIEDADAFFPDLSFLQLLFGRCSLEILQAYWADCAINNDEATLLIKALFPQRPSQVIPLF